MVHPLADRDDRPRGARTPTRRTGGVRDRRGRRSGIRGLDGRAVRPGRRIACLLRHGHPCPTVADRCSVGVDRAPPARAPRTRQPESGSVDGRRRPRRVRRPRVEHRRRSILALSRRVLRDLDPVWPARARDGDHLPRGTVAVAHVGTVAVDRCALVRDLSLALAGDHVRRRSDGPGPAPGAVDVRAGRRHRGAHRAQPAPDRTSRSNDVVASTTRRRDLVGDRRAGHRGVTRRARSGPGRVQHGDRVPSCRTRPRGRRRR